MLHRSLAAWTVVVITVAGAGVARADQCWALTREQADAAVKTLQTSPGRVLAAFCAPCGETAPKRLVKGQIGIRKTDSGFTLTLGGNDIDLAYVYYPVGGDRYRDLAMAASCPVQSVPELVTMK